MHIVYLHQYFRTPNEGGGTRSFEMARRWVASGHQVSMVTTGSDENCADTWSHNVVAGIDVYTTQVPYSNKFGFYQRIVAFVRFAWLAARKAASFDADVIFATSTPLTIALPGVYASKRTKAPMVLEIRDLWPEMPIAIGALKNPFLIYLSRQLEKFAYRHANHIIALSPGMKDGVLKAGVVANKVSVIPNACDIDRFQGTDVDKHQFLSEFEYLQDKKLVVYAGTIGQVNGLEYLVDIAKEAKGLDVDVAFLLVGDGACKTAVAQYAEQAGVLGKNFWMIDPVSKDKVANVLAASSVVLSLFIDLPEMWKNSANKFFDGLAAGKPIAINYKGWQAEFLQKHDAGIVLPADNAGEAAGLICELIAAPERLGKLGQSALGLAEQYFSREILTEQALEVLIKASNTCDSPKMYGKRLFDIIVAGGALLIFLPVMVVIGVLVWASIGSPVLFRQTRPGVGGEPFEIIKFRTMRDDVNQFGRQLPDVARLSRLGSILRKTSLDELPELWNVLRGDMSIVGPRPLLMRYLSYFTVDEQRRHHVRPGITGLAQVSGRNFLNWDSRLAADVEYVDNWSFTLDLRIIGRTIVQVLRRDGVAEDTSVTMRDLDEERTE